MGDLNIGLIYIHKLEVLSLVLSLVIVVNFNQVFIVIYTSFTEGNNW
jgi:hypothetical protein